MADTNATSDAGRLRRAGHRNGSSSGCWGWSSQRGTGPQRRRRDHTGGPGPSWRGLTSSSRDLPLLGVPHSADQSAAWIGGGKLFPCSPWREGAGFFAPSEPIFHFSEVASALVGGARHDKDQFASFLMQQSPVRRLIPSGKLLPFQPLLVAGEGPSRLLAPTEPLLGHCQEQSGNGISALAVELDRLLQGTGCLLEPARAIQGPTEEGEGVGIASSGDKAFGHLDESAGFGLVAGSDPTGIQKMQRETRIVLEAIKKFSATQEGILRSGRAPGQ